MGKKEIAESVIPIRWVEKRKEKRREYEENKRILNNPVAIPLEDGIVDFSDMFNSSSYVGGDIQASFKEFCETPEMQELAKKDEKEIIGILGKKSLLASFFVMDKTKDPKDLLRVISHNYPLSYPTIKPVEAEEIKKQPNKTREELSEMTLEQLMEYKRNTRNSGLTKGRGKGD